MAQDLAHDRGKILIVDDDDDIREMLVARLEHHGFETATAPTGEDALERVDDTNPSLVLLDIMMPGINGYETLERIREHRAFTDLPVIMLSAKDRGEDVVRALQLGANDYAIKPVEFEVLLKRIRRHIVLAAPRAQVLGDYLIHEKIGEGGMGLVYSATQVTTNRKVALKILPRALTVNELFVKRFRQESELAARIDHPNVVKVLGAGFDGETHFIVMELIDGTDLADLREVREFTIVEVLTMGREVASALAELLKLGVIHRDIKPENVILDHDGTAKITDFGVARDTSSRRRITDTGVGIGSVSYSSPEQLEGRGDSRADIYSLGCTLFYAITGVDPFPQDVPTDELYRRKRRRSPSIAAHLDDPPTKVVRLLRRMMAPTPEQRYNTHQAVIDAIDEILGTTRRSVVSRARAWRWASLALGTFIGAMVLWRVLAYG